MTKRNLELVGNETGIEPEEGSVDTDFAPADDPEIKVDEPEPTPNLEERISHRKYSHLMQSLPCILTREEKEKLAQEISETYKEKEEIAGKLDGLKSSAKNLKAQADNLELVIGVMTRIYRAGKELRAVKVLKSVDYSTCLVTYFRKDTGEITASRPIQDDERQQSLLDQ